jgi:hypothetical protein
VTLREYFWAGSDRVAHFSEIRIKLTAMPTRRIAAFVTVPFAPWIRHHRLGPRDNLGGGDSEHAGDLEKPTRFGDWIPRSSMLMNERSNAAASASCS